MLPEEYDDEFEAMLREMAQEIYSSNDNHILTDPSVMEGFGATPDSGQVARPDYQHGSGDYSDISGGYLE